MELVFLRMNIMTLCQSDLGKLFPEAPRILASKVGFRV